MRRPAFLLILSAIYADAVRLQSRRRENPTVAGTQNLEAEEMKGKRPIFVDAFPDAQGSEVDVVLNFSPLFPKESSANSKQWKRWTNAKWECKWDAHILDMRKGSSEVEVVREESATMVTMASVVYDTNAEPATRPSALFNQSTSANERSEVFRWFHHALVLGCPMPSASDSTWYLTLVASDDRVFYERAGIPLVRNTMVKPGTGAVLCTMLFQEKETAAVLEPWARFHLSLGFDQILLYVEDEDASWANRAVANVPDPTKITVVPFYFGEVSKARAFHMQAGMESHCLYQARNRATWLAHADVDEYFDLLKTDSYSIADYLGKLSPNTGAVMVRSQYWADALAEDHTDAAAPFPCYVTCKANSYLPNEVRTKWIARASQIKIINPHIVKTTAKDSLVHVGDPWHEIRLNHFRRCSPKMALNAMQTGKKSECVILKGCEAGGDHTLDNAWKARCTESLRQGR